MKPPSIAIALLLAALGTSHISIADQSEIDAEYPPPFREDFNMEITKVLVKNGVTGCGTYKYRASTKPSDKEYLVYCSRDGKTWTAYMVFIYTGKVLGPYRTE